MKLSKQKEQRVFKTLSSILAETDIEDKIVYKDNGTYHLFGKYTILKTQDGYQAEKTHFDNIKIFSQLKHAVAWATLDNLNRIREANRVLVLDKQLIDTKVQSEVHQRMIKLAKDIDGYILYKAKLQEDLMKKARIVAELDGFVEQIKNWQYKTFREAAK